MNYWLKQLRVHQWVKNLLLFVPLLASFKFFEATPAFLFLGLAFVSFSLVSSAVYIFNDVLDLENDRAHSLKRNRPMASGKISVGAGLLVGSASLLIGLLVGFFVGTNFFIAVLAYLGFTFVYSIWLKHWALVDVISLAGLYTLRVIAGGFASGIEVSYWLLAFSIFFFLSLAWVKRYAELESIQKSGFTQAVGRAYSTTDMPLILAFGASSGVLAVVIFALYLDSAAIRVDYALPQVGWLAIPFIMYLVGRMWFKAHRGEMNQDPLLYLFRDWPTILTVVLLAASLVIAHLGFG